MSFCLILIENFSSLILSFNIFPIIFFSIQDIKHITWQSGGATETADALIQSVNEFRSSTRSHSSDTNKVVILVTDGK